MCLHPYIPLTITEYHTRNAGTGGALLNPSAELELGESHNYVVSDYVLSRHNVLIKGGKG